MKIAVMIRRLEMIYEQRPRGVSIMKVFDLPLVSVTMFASDAIGYDYVFTYVFSNLEFDVGV
jgi:hypothetical protein